MAPWVCRLSEPYGPYLALKSIHTLILRYDSLRSKLLAAGCRLHAASCCWQKTAFWLGSAAVLERIIKGPVAAAADKDTIGPLVADSSTIIVVGGHQHGHARPAGA